MSDWASGSLVGSVVATVLHVAAVRVHHWMVMSDLMRRYTAEATTLGVEIREGETLEKLMARCQQKVIADKAARLVGEVVEQMRPTIAAAKVGEWSGTERGQA